MATKGVVLITGTSTGFGRLFTETLARNGYTVFATMRDPIGKNAKNASELLALAEKESLNIHTQELDVTSEASVETAVRAVVAQAGRIDVVINNAGYPIIGLTETITTEQAQAIMDTNFFGVQRVTRAVLPHMRRQRSGLIVNISSGAGRIVFPTFTVYSATKFALEALTEGYHYELASQGIEAILVEPGAYETPIFGKIVWGSDTERTETYGAVAKVPEKLGEMLGKMAGNAQEVADAVLKVLETPAGQRKLRYRVSPQDTGVDAINEVTGKVQAQLIEGLGLKAETTFTLQKAAGND